MKIHYFEDGISDSSFSSVKSTIMVDRQKIQEFDAVMRLHVNYKHTQKAEAPTHQAHNVSALQGCEGGRQGRGGCGRGGQGGPDAHLKGVVPQEEVDKVIIVEAKWYPHPDYSKFTIAEKQKHYQLMKKINKTGKSLTTVAEMASAISAVSAAATAVSELTSPSNKRAAEDGEPNNHDAAADSKWGWNRNNPAVAGCQECMPKKPKPDQSNTALCLRSIQPDWQLTLDGTLLTLVLK
jgi:hypothetical protein